MEKEETLQKKSNLLSKRSSNYMSLKHMKSLIVLVVGLLAIGCGNSKIKKMVVGEYETKLNDGDTHKLVFLDDGVVESYLNGKKHGEENKWSIVKGEIHAGLKEFAIEVFRINPDKSITTIAWIMHDIGDEAAGLDDGPKRTDLSKDEQYNWKKIK